MQLKAMISIFLIGVALVLCSTDPKKISWKGLFYSSSSAALILLILSKIFGLGPILKNILAWLYLPSYQASSWVITQLFQFSPSSYSNVPPFINSIPLNLVIVVLSISVWHSPMLSQLESLLRQYYSPFKKINLSAAELFIFCICPWLGPIGPLVTLGSRPNYPWQKHELVSVGIFMFASNSFATYALLNSVGISYTLLSANLFLSPVCALLISRILYPVIDPESPPDLKPLSPSIQEDRLISALFNIFKGVFLGLSMYLCWAWALQIGETACHFLSNIWTQSFSLVSLFKGAFYPVAFLMQLNIADFSTSTEVLATKFLNNEYFAILKWAALQKQLSTADGLTLQMASLPFFSFAVWLPSVWIWNLYSTHQGKTFEFKLLLQIGIGALAANILSINFYHLLPL